MCVCLCVVFLAVYVYLCAARLMTILGTISWTLCSRQLEAGREREREERWRGGGEGMGGVYIPISFVEFPTLCPLYSTTNSAARCTFVQNSDHMSRDGHHAVSMEDDFYEDDPALYKR